VKRPSAAPQPTPHTGPRESALLNGALGKAPPPPKIPQLRPADASRLVGSRLAGHEPRWSHICTVGRLASELHADGLVSATVAAAAWLHDVGYAPSLTSTGMHAVDGARYLSELGAPEPVVALVAHHTGARWEAEERGLSDALRALPEPDEEDLDALTLLDLAVGPAGQLLSPDVRLAEVLHRYVPDHPVHRAVSRSMPTLLAAAATARRRIGLPDEWPLTTVESVVEAARSRRQPLTPGLLAASGEHRAC